MFKDILSKCILGKALTELEAEQTMDLIMKGEVTASQIASLISIMRFRGETTEEIIGFVRAMRSHMVPINYDHDNIIDTCGTGGDGASTFNISTSVAIMLSALGLKVAKHGNRAVSSKSGSADVLEALSIPIQSNADEAKRALELNNMSFLFAPLYHSAMKHAVTPRKEVGFRTVFNLLGPLSNPAGAKYQVIGVYDTKYAEKMAQALLALGSKNALFVTGRDGLDEISVMAETDCVELKDGKISRYVLTPEEVGLDRGRVEDIQVSSVQESAILMESIFKGTSNKSARNIVLLNAGAALYVSEHVPSIQDGIQLAEAALNDGKVYDHFLRMQINKERKNYA